MKRYPSFLRSFGDDTQGFAAVEFGLALPLLVLMVLGFVELDRYAWATRQMESTAASIAQMLTQSTKPVDPADLSFVQESVKVQFPRVLQDSARLGHKWNDDIAVGISSVTFKELTPGCVGAACKYHAKVAWSGGNSRRPCGASLSPVADTQAPSQTTLPTDAFGPNAIIVVDLTYTYKPMFAQKIFGGITLKRSAYLQPRYVPELKYSVAKGDALVTTCV